MHPAVDGAPYGLRGFESLPAQKTMARMSARIRQPADKAETMF